MNPARWAGRGKLLGLWPGDGDGLVYNNEGQAPGYLLPSLGRSVTIDMLDRRLVPPGNLLFRQLEDSRDLVSFLR